jgi:sensor histidine kinase regulating citrate/malate metabolism
MDQGNIGPAQLVEKSRNWNLILVGILVLGILVCWMWQSYKHGRILRAFAVQSATALARTVETLASEEIASEDWDELQKHADRVVSSRPMAFVAIVNSDGISIVHTDRSLLGQKFEKPKLKEIVCASSPVAVGGGQRAVVWVGVRIPDR